MCARYRSRAAASSRVAHLAGRPRGLLLEPVAHPRRELGGGLLGERDHDELIDLSRRRGR